MCLSMKDNIKSYQDKNVIVFIHPLKKKEKLKNWGDFSKSI